MSIKILVIAGAKQEYAEFERKYNYDDSLVKYIANKQDYLGLDNAFVWCYGTYYNNPIFKTSKSIEDFLSYCDTHNITYNRQDF